MEDQGIRSELDEVDLTESRDDRIVGT